METSRPMQAIENLSRDDVARALSEAFQQIRNEKAHLKRHNFSPLPSYRDKTTLLVTRTTRNALFRFRREENLESYDAAIKKLLTLNEKHAQTPSKNLFFSDANVLGDFEIKPPERDKEVKPHIEISSEKAVLKKSALKIGENSYIDFQYYPPIKDSLDICLNIQITGVVIDGRRKDIKEFLSDRNNEMSYYFKLLERVLQNEVDPGFKLPHGPAAGRIYNLDYWQSVYSIYRLSPESFTRDVKEKINRFIRGENAT